MPTHRPHRRASNTQGHIPYTHRHKQVLKGTEGHIHRPCAENTRAHTTAHTDVHTQSHFVRSKGNDTVSPHPHRTTHKHANRSTHTGGCCVAPTSTCGVFSFCLFWERKTNRFSSPQPLGAIAPQPPADVPGAAPSPPCVQASSTLPAALCRLPTFHSLKEGPDSLPCANTWMEILKHTNRDTKDLPFHRADSSEAQSSCPTALTLPLHGF